MKIYKNPWVTRESYFVKTGAAKSAKMEAAKSAGYSIDFWGGRWNVRKAEYYNRSLAEMPVIAESRASIQAVIDKAVLDTVLGCVGIFNADDVSTENWINVEDKLPENETEVLIACNRNGFRFVCPAIYEDGTVLTQDSIWNWYELDSYGTYSEENDDYFIPEGWWENRQFTPDDVYNNPVDCAVTHWTPLPKLPEMKGREADD